MADATEMGKLIRKAERRCKDWTLHCGPTTCWAMGISQISADMEQGGPANSPEGALHDLLRKLPSPAPGSDTKEVA